MSQPTIFEAVASGDISAVRSIVERDPDVNVRDPSTGTTPLQVAALRARANVVAFLIDSDAEIDAKEMKYGVTALLLAVGERNRNIVKLLRSKGASVADCPHGHGPLKEWESDLQCWTCGWPRKNRRKGELAVYLRGLRRTFAPAGRPARPPSAAIVAECPHGHGPLKMWEGQLRCWTCGWTEEQPQGPAGPRRCPQCDTEMRYGTNNQWPSVAVWWCDSCGDQINPSTHPDAFPDYLADYDSRYEQFQ